MEKIRFHAGMENLKKIDGEGVESVIRSLETISPDFWRYIVEFAFRDIYARRGLSLQEREMITLASLLTAGGYEPQLEVHIQTQFHIRIRFPPKAFQASRGVTAFAFSVAQEADRLNVCGNWTRILHGKSYFLP